MRPTSWCVLAATLLGISSVAVGGGGGCGGGCGSEGAAEGVMEAIPADITGFVAVSVPSLMDQGTLDQLEEEAVKAGGQDFPKDLVGLSAKIAYGAFVIRAAPKPAAPDCEKVADHVLDLLAKEIQGPAPKEMRGQMVDECKRQPPAETACYLAAGSSDEMARCKDGSSVGSSPDPEHAVIWRGSFDADAVAPLVAKLSKLEAKGERWVLGEQALAKLGKDGMAVGASGLVDAIVEAHAGRRDRVDKNAELKGYLDKVDLDAAIVGAMGAGLVPEQVKGGAFSIGVGGTLEVKAYVVGDPMLSVGAQMGLAQAKQEVAKVDAQVIATAAEELGIDKATADGWFKGVIALVQSAEIVDDTPGIRLTAKAEIDVKAVIAVLAKSSLVAFKKYMMKAKTVEAQVNLDQIARGAEQVFETPQVSPSGEMLPCRFPPTVVCTPPGSPCDHPGKKYPGASAAWGNETWKALHFELTDPHYFRYCFKSSGSGATAHFTATAQSDLDCDGEWSTFEKTGSADAEAGGSDCLTKRSGGLFIDKEGE